MIYSALFEGDTTRQLPKITSFLVWLFGFFIFLDLFKYFEKIEKNKSGHLRSNKLSKEELRSKNGDLDVSIPTLGSSSGDN